MKGEDRARGKAGATREQSVSRAFVTLADTLVDDYDVVDLLHQLVGFTVELLAADAVGIVLADVRGELHAVVASSEAVGLMELLRLQSFEGPSLDSYRQAALITAPDLHNSTARWPAFVAAVREQSNFRSVHVLPLRLRGQAIGAMNLFYNSPGVLPDADLALGQALADVATIGILQERTIRRGGVLNEQLQTALNSRVVIEQAKGILTQHGALDMEDAFDRLRRHARTNRLRLVDVARNLVIGALAPAAIIAPQNP